MQKNIIILLILLILVYLYFKKNELFLRPSVQCARTANFIVL